MAASPTQASFWSPKGLDRGGFLLKAMAGTGLYRYHSGTFGFDVIGSQSVASLLAGWRVVRGSMILSVMAGPDIQSHRLTPDDPAAGLRGGYTGIRSGFELWYEPRPGMMLSADGSLSSIGPGYSARAAFGWRMLDRFYIGPEIQAFTSGNEHRQMRAGLHLTGMRHGRIEWSAAAGWAQDSDDRQGAYGRVGILTRR